MTGSAPPPARWRRSASAAKAAPARSLAALAIHRLSARAQGPFITLDCGAIPPDRLESELFGHRRGAFVGALSDRLGAAELADGGTLFLDGVGELHPTLQPRLLRFLQSGLVHPLGAEAARRVNLRILSASTLPLAEAVRMGQLREDLFYRLQVVGLQMPPLRRRGEDIVPLAETFLARFAAIEGRSFTRITPEAMALLRAYPWPGNVRELSNVLRAVTVLHEGEELTAAMLPPELASPAPSRPGAGLATVPDLSGLTLAEVERAAIEAALTRHEGAVQKAAADLGVSPSTLYRKLESWRTD
ncbi:sigma 54-interacting transcriptional regulator [Rhodobacter capsulatus]|uniref:sigma 54-interacting transcriptional regulator n=1 Tax=Rhodobacter capsulatus TaxID=1061 RepID=UPI004025F069